VEVPVLKARKLRKFNSNQVYMKLLYCLTIFLSLGTFILPARSQDAADKVATDAKLLKGFSEDWEHMMKVADARVKDLDALIAKDPTNEGLVVERNQYTMPGIALKQLSVVNAMSARPSLAVSPNVDKILGEKVILDQAYVTKAQTMFLVAKLKVFMAENPNYGSEKAGQFSRSYLENAVLNSTGFGAKFKSSEYFGN